MSEVKKLAVFLDGTWNTVNDDTNVWRMKSLCALGPDQLSYYSTGVGTVFGEKLIGGGFGYGLDDEVIRAYQWISENYLPGDRIFIFGFSRGAFTARSLAGFIAKCGLLKPGSPISLNQLYARYRKGNAPHTILALQTMADAKLTPEDKWLKKYSLSVPIWFQGVWDTVGALGIPFGNLAKVSRSQFAFLETDLRINEDRVFHALAIDEHRKTFAPTLWKKSVQAGVATYDAREIEDVEQRWFVGAHGDVGGGYDNGLLAQVPLKWLMDKAARHGLKFKSSVVIDGDESQATIHDSFGDMLHGWYRLSKFGIPYYRPVGPPPNVHGSETTTTINETIDASVFDRWRADPGYRPSNLATWARAHRAEIESFHDAVRADDLTVVTTPPLQGS
jgi:uncharacterized protein (DUF2235 family)